MLQSVVHHKRRHDELQRFMLATDSATVLELGDQGIDILPGRIANALGHRLTG